MNTPQSTVTKNYTKPAILTLVLYCLLWLPGCIVNIIYLRKAQVTKRMTGVQPGGYGCLLTLFIVCGALPLVFSILFALLALINPSAAGFH